MILKSRIFSVSVLRKETDTSLIGRFVMSGDTIDKFANVNTIKAVKSAPVVTDYTTAWFDVKLIRHRSPRKSYKSPSGIGYKEVARFQMKTH